jgi:hypothetical protein
MVGETLTQEERSVLHSWSRGTSLKSWIGFYIAILVPMTAFAIYGIAKSDVIAVGIAYSGLLLYSLWNIASQFSRAGTYKGLSAKLIALDETRGARD